jgi:hypothetical protein
MRKWIKIKVSRIFVFGCILAGLVLVKLFMEYIVLWNISDISDITFGVIIKGYEGLSIIACIACFVICFLLFSYASLICKGIEKNKK